MKPYTLTTVLLVLFIIAISSYMAFLTGKRSCVEETRGTAFKKEELEGEWSLYFDCPNTILNFQNGELSIESCSGDYQDSEPTKVQYVYGNGVIKYESNGEMKKIVVIEIENETHLLPFDEYNNNSSPVFWKVTK